MRHAVVVRPAGLPSQDEAFALALSHELGATPQALRQLLARGPVTVESDLSPHEARALCARLRASGLPAEIVNEPALGAGEEAATGEPVAASSPAALVWQLDDLDLELDAGVFGEGSGELTPPLPSPNTPAPRPEAAAPQAQEEDPWGELLRQAPAPTPSTPRQQPATPLATPPAQDAPMPSAAQPSGWAALGIGASLPLEPGVSAPPVTPPAPLKLPAASAPKPPSAPVVQASAPPALDFGAEPLTPDLASQPARPSPPLEPEAPARATARAGASEASALERGRRFDGSHFATAFTPAEAPPPYAPEGYDPRPPHAPQVARALSVMAPGAGQVYNGQEDAALRYGLTFLLIRPWIESARQARERAATIASFYAPRPREDSLRRALLYALLWYGAVALLVVVVISVVRVATKPPDPAIADAALMRDQQRALEHGEMMVRQARIASHDAMMDAYDVRPATTVMSDEERAMRLFLTNLPECVGRRYGLCEAAMKRVTSLDPTHRDAFRLQAWASVLGKGGQPSEVPEVVGVDTIEAFELLVALHGIEDALRLARQPQRATNDTPDASPDALVDASADAPAEIPADDPGAAPVSP